MNGFDYGDPGSDPSSGGYNLNSWTGVGGTGPGSMYVLPGEGGGERADTGLTVPTDNSGYIGTTGLPPGVTPGTPGAGWNNPGLFGTFLTDLQKGGSGILSNLFGGQYGSLAQMLAFGGAGALANKLAGGNSTPPPVGYQGDIPKYKAVREQLPIPTVTESGQARRPGQGGIQYFTPIQYVPEGGIATPTEKPQPSAAQKAANEGLAALPYASGTRATDAQIAQLYQEVFGRAPDAQGLAFYRASGFSPSQIKEQLLASPEYKGLLGAKAQQYAQGTDASKEQISQIYRDVLGREADAGGLSFYDSSKFSPEQIKADIMKSPEYRERAITQMYQDILGRAPDQGGLRFYMNPEFTLDQIKQNLLQSPEYLGKDSEIREVPRIISLDEMYKGVDRKQAISDLYKNFLGREPDEGGLQFYMNPDFTLEQIANDISRSEEATKRLPTSSATGDGSSDTALAKLLRNKGTSGKVTSNSIGSDFGKLVDISTDLKTESNLKKLMEMGLADPALEKFVGPVVKKSAAGGYMPGGIAMLAGGRYLRGPGDGVSDSIHAKFEQSGQPARLADGEFVIDARTVSEIGNGSSEAGARKLYAMMDRVHKARKTAKRGKPSGADRELTKLA